MTAAAGTSVSYDSNQNITAALGSSYGYDAANRLTSATIGGTGYGFSYDPANRLYNSTATGETFLYAGQQLAGEYNSSGVMIARHIPGPALDMPVASLFSSGVRYQQVADERGSVVGLTDASAALAVVNRYDEYGVPNAGYRFQYTGQAYLAPGLYHYRARAYAPQIGRFLQTDPIGYADGMNIYGYVGGDPVNRVDPSGLEWGKPISRGECSDRGGVVAKAGDGKGGPDWCVDDFSVMSHVSFGDPGSASELDAVIVTGYRSGRLGQYPVQYNLPYEPVFFHYPNGTIVKMLMKHEICSYGSGPEFDQYSPRNAPAAGFIAVSHVHQRNNFPFPGPGDGINPARLGIPTYGISTEGAWVIRPGTSLTVELLAGRWGDGFDLAGYTAQINAYGGSESGGRRQRCRRG